MSLQYIKIELLNLYQMLSGSLSLFGLPLVFWLIISVTIYLTLKFRFVNITMFHKSIKTILFNAENEDDESENKEQHSSVSPIKAFFVQASATLGLGNIAGSLFALYMGGAGTAIWVIIFSILFSIIKFNEIILGKVFRNVNDKGEISGGAFYILSKSFKGKLGKTLGTLYAIAAAATISSWSGFQLGQSISAITNGGHALDCLNHSYFPLILSIVIMSTIFLILNGGIARVSDTMSNMVPTMVLIYFGIFVYTLVSQSSKVPEVFNIIFRSAFNLKAISAGGFASILVSMNRSLLATEAGLGTAAIPYASSNDKYPARQAFLGLLDAVIVSFVVSCGIIMLLLLNVNFANISAENIGINLTRSAISTNLGLVSEYAFLFVIFCFSFTTLVGNGYYIQATLKFLNSKTKTARTAAIYCTITLICSIKQSLALIQMIDIINYLMILLNLCGIVKSTELSLEQLKLYKEYMKKDKG